MDLYVVLLKLVQNVLNVFWLILALQKSFLSESFFIVTVSCSDILTIARDMKNHPGKIFLEHAIDELQFDLTRNAQNFPKRPENIFLRRISKSRTIVKISEHETVAIKKDSDKKIFWSARINQKTFNTAITTITI